MDSIILSFVSLELNVVHLSLATSARGLYSCSFPLVITSLLWGLIVIETFPTHSITVKCCSFSIKFNVDFNSINGYSILPYRTLSGSCSSHMDNGRTIEVVATGWLYLHHWISTNLPLLRRIEQNGSGTEGEGCVRWVTIADELQRILAIHTVSSATNLTRSYYSVEQRSEVMVNPDGMRHNGQW